MARRLCSVFYESAFSPRHRSENRLESLPIYSRTIRKLALKGDDDEPSCKVPIRKSGHCWRAVGTQELAAGARSGSCRAATAHPRRRLGCIRPTAASKSPLLSPLSARPRSTRTDAPRPPKHATKSASVRRSGGGCRRSRDGVTRPWRSWWSLISRCTNGACLRAGLRLGTSARWLRET